MIIAIGHRKGVGKDTFAIYLIDKLAREGVAAERFAFADALKDMAHRLWSWAGLKSAKHYETKQGRTEREVILPRLGKTPRQLWIELGNKMREIYGETWIEFVLAECRASTSTFKIITDLRYPNELENMGKHSALTVKVQTHRVPNTDDVADIALQKYAGWDYTINNNGTIGELENLCYYFAQFLLNKMPGKKIWGMP